MKRVALFVFALLLSTLSTVFIMRFDKAEDNGNAAVANIAEVRRLVTDKTEYEVGEPIMVTAWTPDLSDKILLASVEGNIVLRWKLVGEAPSDGLAASGNGSGIPVDITQGKIPGAASSSAYKNLPAGHYVVYLQNYNNTERVSQIYITIK